MAEEATEQGPWQFIVSNSDEIASQVGDYGAVVADSLYFVVAGMLAVFLLHTLASRFLYPYLPNARLARVVFGAMYVLVLVVTILMALRRIGLDTGPIGSVLILSVLIGAVLVYFLIPFMPKLPFVPGHMIETGGVLGTVDSISSFHTTIRKFNGNIVFIPNALVMASKIENFTYTPERRIELKMVVGVDADPEVVREQVLAAVAGDLRVVADPAPAMYVNNADANGVELVLYCWVANADYLVTRSDLWSRLVKLTREGEGIALATPKQEVHLKDLR